MLRLMLDSEREPFLPNMIDYLTGCPAVSSSVLMTITSVASAAGLVGLSRDLSRDFPHGV